MTQPSAASRDHGIARDLLAERLDAPLGSRDSTWLDGHLAACGACRAVDAEHEEVRAALRRLSLPVPPRDLAARTFAAFDREDASRARHSAGRVPGLPLGRPGMQRTAAGGVPGLPSPSRGRRAAALAIPRAAVGLATTLLVAGLLVLPGGPLNPQRLGPTPLAINPGQLAYLGMEGDEVLLYRTRLDRDCPPDSGDCVGMTEPVAQRVVLPYDVRVSDLRIDPGGQLAALSGSAGSAGSGTTYYVIDFASTSSSLPMPSPSTSATATPTLTPATSGSVRPASSGGVVPGTPDLSRDPITSGSASPAASGGHSSAGPSASPTPAGSGASGAGVAGAGGDSGAPTASTGTAAPSASARPGASPSARPAPSGAGSPVGTGPTSPPWSTGLASETAAEATAAVIVPPPSAGAGGTAARSGPATLPPASAQPILTDVWPAGMPAAWSADGSILAFSARPADGSAGPDIYTWSPGQRLAKRLTNDHNSSFASWDGARIVGSIVVADPERPSRLVPRSFVIDLTTGARRFIETTGIWLPSVDPEGEHVVYWEGDLSERADMPVPTSGRLVFATWSVLDPFAPAGTESSAPASSGGSLVASASPGAASSGDASSSRPPSSSPDSPTSAATSGSESASASDDSDAAVPSPAISGATSTPDPGAGGSGQAHPTPAPSISSPAPKPTPRTASETATPSPRPSAQGKAEGVASSRPARSELVPVGTTADGRVVDWLVAWSDDGRAMAVWTAAELGASIGTLTVFAVDPDQPVVQLDATIVGPVTARRVFSIGSDRIAWITPPDVDGHVILRVYSWGPHGGELRSRELEQGDVIPAF